MTQLNFIAIVLPLWCLYLKIIYKKFMRNYEMLCVLPGTLTEDEVAAAVDAIKQEINKNEAAQVTVENLGKSKLAYPIKHIRYGYFQLFHFELEENKLKDLKRGVQLVNNVLRVVSKTYNPKKVGSYTLAQDPTALSAPAPERKFGSLDRRTPDRKPPVREYINKEVAEKSEEKVEDKEVEDKKVENKGIEMAEAAVEEKKEIETPKIVKKPKTKISLDDIDQKLDEILQEDIDKV